MRGPDGKIKKFLIHDEDYKTPGVKLEEHVPQNVVTEIEAIIGRNLTAADFDSSGLSERRFVNGEDTLTISEGSGGELMAEVPAVLFEETGFSISLYEFENKFTHPDADVYFIFTKNDSGEVTGITYQTQDAEILFQPVD